MTHAGRPAGLTGQTEFDRVPVRSGKNMTGCITGSGYRLPMTEFTAVNRRFYRLSRFTTKNGPVFATWDTDEVISSDVKNLNRLREVHDSKSLLTL